MQAAEKKDLHAWANYLGQADIPVLAETGRLLAELHENDDDLSSRQVARVVLKDPLMTAKLLRFLQQHKPRNQRAEIALVEQAILMLGIEPFYRNVQPQPTVELLLESQPEALTHLMQVVGRAHRAADYAIHWAARLNDLHFDEVYVAALLHDLAEILLWCFAPADMLRIRHDQLQDKTLRSRAAQEQVLGFSLANLQLLLAQQWSLPQLLLNLMEDAQAQNSRVRNVELAVNLARHSANGWNDAALPDDYRDIGALLHLSVDKVMELVCPPGTARDGTPAR
ncbi:MAG: HDOD domain-containing protein [Betaproteobacteria bacterium]|nr:HDOD domain-containing protein [Betaproteobacteria bacterium]MDE1981773.1 HDOD domain-containing protein [Betaproteobacteria bacterium]MDE2131204.1 HDOD domain-containing protein [Betaproteobacteria bacterium]MDE2211202.1 HDOD domain-containing protein [Betaproteobacteria bacterium]